MPLINCEVNFISTWSEFCVIISTNVTNQAPTFEITETNLYAPCYDWLKNFFWSTVKKW